MAPIATGTSAIPCRISSPTTALPAAPIAIRIHISRVRWATG